MFFRFGKLLGGLVVNFTGGLGQLTFGTRNRIAGQYPADRFDLAKDDLSHRFELFNQFAVFLFGFVHV